MSNYGIPYMGSKSKIAKDIINVLPKWKRFVDLFGGGFAMSHCALLSGNYESVYYNEINPLLVPMLKDAIAGKYNYNVFKPQFITREKFFELKDVDGYVKYIWSFGNDGQTYMYGKNIERDKHIMHNAIVFDRISAEFLKLFPTFKCFPSDDIKSRRLFLKTLTKEHLRLQHFPQLERLQQLEQLERLQQLEQLQQLERLQRLQFNIGSYLDYEYQDGDVVYCDPPYENTAKYTKDGFNHAKFYDWVKSRPYLVFVSSYEISDPRFLCVWEKDKRSLMAAKGDNLIKKERLYI